MDPQPRKPKRKNTEFWRACRYLGPYRRIVTISVVCAFAVGFIFTTGLGAMLPILRILINGDTLQTWVDRQIVENRLGVRVSDIPGSPIERIEENSPAVRAGLELGDSLVPLTKYSVYPEPHSVSVATAHGTIQ